MVGTASGFFFLLWVFPPRRLCRWSTSKQSSVKWSEQMKMCSSFGKNFLSRPSLISHSRVMFFLETGKRWNETPLSLSLWDLFEQYGAEQKGMTNTIWRGSDLEYLIFPPLPAKLGLNSLTSRKHRQVAKYIPRWRGSCTIFWLLWTRISLG